MNDSQSFLAAAIRIAEMLEDAYPHRDKSHIMAVVVTETDRGPILNATCSAELKLLTNALADYGIKDPNIGNVLLLAAEKIIDGREKQKTSKTWAADVLTKIRKSWADFGF